jgi:hypothetical protein
MVSNYSAYRRGADTVSPDVIDRILLGACAVIWLVLIGVSVAATVALADLGQGFHKAARNSHTTWVLYVVIAVSALIIAGAIPVLLRARRSVQSDPPAAPVGGAARVPRGASERSIRPGTPGRRAVAEAVRPGSVQTTDGWSGEEVDRIWLRGTLGLTGAIGIALVAVATATYLMAVGSDGGAWIAYGLAGIITAAMPVLEVLHVRQLRRVVTPQ